MIAMTNANMRNLPTTPAPAPEKSWDKQDRAKAAAIKELGAQAIPGFDFDVYKCDGRWLWRALAADKRPPISDAQVKANGGKRAVEAMVSAPDRLAGEAVTAAAVEKIMAAAKKPVDTTEDANGVPAFLKRDGDSSIEAQEALVSKHKKTTGPDRVIKNPPDAKGAKKRAEKTAGKGISKTAMVGQLLLRKEGCTTADILKATGWPSVSVPAASKAVGLGLRKEKDGKVTRYFGVPKK